MEPGTNSSGDESPNCLDLPAAFSKRVKINTEQSSHSDPKLPTIPEGNDDIVKETLKKYPWLEYCQQTKLYKYKPCSDSGLSNNWTQGKDAVKANRADEHLVSTQHKKATGVYLNILDQSTQPKIENTIATTRQQIKHAEIASIFRDVYFLAYNNLPLNLIEGGRWPTCTS
jgi:hypothetical protein